MTLGPASAGPGSRSEVEEAPEEIEAFRLVAIHRYPIKSCGGTRLDRAEVSARGVEGDRSWMLVDPGGRFLSQRRLPRMALIRPRITSTGLEITAPGMEPLLVNAEDARGRLEVEIWRDRCDALEMGAKAERWFSAFLGVPSRLVRQDPEADRPVDPEFRGGRTRPQLSFADGLPFLLTSTGSLDDLNERMGATLPMDRFRPNLVVSGPAPWAEDAWRHVEIGGLEFAVVKPCARCAVTTVDQATATKGEEPLATLGRFRRSERGILFGQNLVHLEEGVLEAGARVRVLEKGRRRG